MKNFLCFFCSLLLVGCLNGNSMEEELATSTKSPLNDFLTILPDNDILDGGILSNKPCSAPCFYNITPGLTNHFEAKEILYKIDKNKACKEMDYYDEISNRRIVGWACSNISVTYNESTGLVNQIRFEPTIPITLQEIINVQGEPDSIAVIQDNTYDSITTTSNIFYLAKKILLPVLLPIDGDKYIISPTTLISAAIYMDNNEMAYTTSVFYEDIVTWGGFRMYP